MRCSKFLLKTGICVTSFLMGSTNITSSAPIPVQDMEQNEQVPVMRMIEDMESHEPEKEDNIEFISIMAESVLDEYTIVGDEEEIPEEVISEEENKEEYVEIDVVVSYYTSSADENGGYTGMNALGGKLTETSIAIPRPKENSLVKYGTVIEFEDLGEAYMDDYNGKHLTRIADDCGNVNHIRIREDGVYRMDIYCPRFKNESTSEYKKRVTSYGKYETVAKVLIKK